MRATKLLRKEQDLIEQFLGVFAQGVVNTGQNKPMQAGFFIYAANFIQGYIESYLRKEAVLLNALEEQGVSPDGGPLGQMIKEQQETRQMAGDILSAAHQWLEGDTNGRSGAIWASSGYLTMLRQHIDRSRTIIFPLAEQMITLEDQHQMAENFNQLTFEEDAIHPPEHYAKIIAMLKEEADEWK